ncbi:chitin synthase-domain-containing protein, partial [Gaertneriomyces semiglobifer]
MHDADVLHTLIMIPAYSESLSSLTATLDSIARSDFPKSHMCMVVVADGIVQGSGNDKPTPDYLISLMERDSRFEYEMRGSAAPVWLPEALPYVAVAEGMKRKNFARVYAGWYKDSRKAKAGDGEINVDRVPMIVIVKSGTPEEQNMPKPGNRGKRDSQLMLMQFLSRLMFDDRFSALDFDLYEKLKALAGYPASKYQVCLMVDADTRLEKDAISHLVDAFADPKVMGVCGETRICNKMGSWVTAIQVYEYYISHHLSKAFESIFGGVTCLPGCFSGYRIKVPHQKKFADDLYPSHVDTNEFVPILANPDVIATYGEHQVHTLHRKNLLLLGEDRYLTTLMLQAFPKRKNIFVPKAICHTVVPDEFKVLLSQRRRWINSTIHNLWCLIWVRGLCGVFCFSMQFVVFMELIGSLILPAATGFTIYLLVNTFTSANPQILPLILLAAVLGLPAILILLTIRNIEYGFWFFVYLLALPIWQVVLPLYAFWRFDEFGWGETRKIAGEDNGHGDGEEEGVFDWKGIQMKRLEEWLIEKGRADDTKRRTALQLARES